MYNSRDSSVFLIFGPTAMHFSFPNKERDKAKYRAEHSFDDPMMRRRRNPSNLSGGDSPALSSGTKTTRKRPKYLSLRRQLSNSDTNTSPRLRPLRHYYTRRNSRRILKTIKSPQPTLHRPSLTLENSQTLDDNVALLFTSSDDATAIATLKGLLVDCDEEAARRTEAGTSGEESVSLRCTYCGSGSPLIKSAMKSGYSSHQEGGEDHEEKWVHYDEVVEKKEEEVSSNYCTAAARAGGMLCLSLKLDYQEVLDAWSDKGSLFIRHGIGMDESPQTVPDLCPEFDGLSSGISDWFANVANLWRVPEKGETGNMDCEDKEERMRIREASVLRYKEKRHNRLFAKRIRYEVRKLNAEKRPRIKGRFVRRDCED